MGKEEIACNAQFLLFPQCFLLSQKIVSPFVNIFDIISLFAAELEEPRIGISGKGLTLRAQKKENCQTISPHKDIPKHYHNFMVAFVYSAAAKWTV